MSDTIRTVTVIPRGTKVAPDPRAIAPGPPPSVLEGTLSPRLAIQKDSLGAPFDPTKPYTKIGEELDPVLAFHLGRTHL